MKKLCLIFLFGLYQHLAFTQDIFTTTPNQSITFGDNIIPLSVTGLSTLMDDSYGLEKVCIDLTHGYLEDLTLTLIAPNGDQVLLSKKNGGSGTQYNMTCFTGVTSDPLITAGSPPYNGSYQPEEQLGTLNTSTIQADGNWQLKINDDFSFDDGTLHSFSLTFSNNPAIIPSATNDECANAISLPINPNYICITKTTGNIIDASASSNIPTCSNTPIAFDDDIWFEFTANKTALDFVIDNISGTSSELIYQVLEGTCQSLTEVYCDEGLDNLFSLKNLSIGNQYWLRIASKTTDPNQNITFDICVKEGIPDPPPNDECSGAFVISYSGGCLQVAGTVAGATPSSQGQSCPDAGSFTNDVWFSFVPTQTNMQLLVSDIQGLTKDLDFQIGTGTCNSYSQHSCFYQANAGSTIIIPANNLTIGNTYFLRVATLNDAPRNTTFKICLALPTPPPSNDECINAISIVPDDNICTLVSGTLDGATNSGLGFNCDPSIEEDFDDDVWFKFTASQTAQGISISNITGSTQDLIYEVLTGTCGSLVSVLCQDDPDEIISLDGLTIGQTYYFRVASYLDLVQNTTFDICIGKNNLLVTNTLDAGEGSLRFAVSNTNAGDTVKFASNINGSNILLASPSIIVDKNIVFHNDYGNNIKIGNSDPNNTDFLLIIRNQLRIEGLQLEGTSTQAMKIKIETPGSMLIYEE